MNRHCRRKTTKLRTITTKPASGTPSAGLAKGLRGGGFSPFREVALMKSETDLKPAFGNLRPECAPFNAKTFRTTLGQGRTPRTYCKNEVIFSQQLGVLSKRKLLVSIPSQIAHLHGFACRSEIKWELNPQVVG